MSISTVALIPRVVRFAMVLALQSMCLWLPAVGSLAGETPTPAYRFESFAAAQMNPDRAASAIELWKFVAAALHRDYGDAPVERMRDYFMFTAIGSGHFPGDGPGLLRRETTRRPVRIDHSGLASGRNRSAGLSLACAGRRLGAGARGCRRDMGSTRPTWAHCSWGAGPPARTHRR
jgi:hypothetical protein